MLNTNTKTRREEHEDQLSSLAQTDVENAMVSILALQRYSPVRARRLMVAAFEALAFALAEGDPS